MDTNSPSLKMQPNSTIAIVHSNISGWRMTLPGDKGVWGISMQGTGAKCIWWIMRKKMRKHQSAGTSTAPQRIFIEGMTTNQCGTQVS
jgi:hypothetical protein